MTAAVEGSNKQQEGCHADNGDNERQAEAVLIGFRWSFTPQHHVTDSRLATKENLRGRKQSPGLLSPPHPVVSPSIWGLLPPVPPPTLPTQTVLSSRCLSDKGASTSEDPGLRAVQDKTPYLSQVIPFVFQQLIHDFRRKLRCGKEGKTAVSRVQPRVLWDG